MALAALLAAVVVLSIAGQAQHAPWQVTVLSPESYPLAGGTQQILDLAASVLLPGHAFAQSVTLDPTPTGSITDAGALELLSPRGIATFTSDGRTYAAVASFGGSYVGGGVQILDITDPRNIAAAGHIPDSSDTELSGAWGIATFTSDGRTYAAVTSQRGDAVQILDVTDPYSVTAAGSITDSSGDLVLESPRGIAVFVSGNSTYAAVAASGDDNGVQILNVTDPYSVTAAGSITDGGALELGGARGIAVFVSGNSTYAAVAASGGDDDGVQILNITDPYSVTAAGSIANIRDLELDGARSIAIFESGNSTYAAVAATFDDAVQILDVTDPYSVTAAGSVTNTDDLELERPRGIATFTSGGSAYAAVAASDSDVVQILDVTDPHSVTAAGSINNTDTLELNGPQAIAIFESGGGTYAAVAARDDDGVQIIHLAGNNAPTVDTGPDQTVSEGEPVSMPWTASDPDGDTLMYVWSQSPADPAITLVSPDSSPTTFTAPPVDSKTVIALTLTASDGTAISSDTLRVTITGPAVGARLNLTAAGSIIDTNDLRLRGASGVAVFASGGSTYAAVTAFNEGVQILDVTDPYSVAAAGSIADDDALELGGPAGIATFESGGSTYAAVAASTDSGVQILNVTDPSDITAAGSINNTDALELNGPQGIAIFESGGSTYAAVAAYVDDGVQILDVSNPYSVTAAGSINNTGTLELNGPQDIAIFASGGSTYAAVAALDGNGVQILNVTDPHSVTAAGSITNTDDLKLDGARGIAVFVSGNSTYAAVAAYRDSAVQVLNITDPSDITAAGSINNTDAPRLQAPRGIAVFVSGNSTYAAVAAPDSSAVQVLDVTDPYNVTAAGRIGDNISRVLYGAWDIATFTSGGGTYAAVTAGGDHGVQIIRIDDDLAAVQPPEGSFITTWQTTTANEPITIPVGGATGNYTVDWGDGSSTTHITDAEHTYAAAGEYTVSISGDFTEIKLYPDDTNAEKLKSIKQWGNISWTTMEEAFRGASNMVYNATDAPDLSGVADMSGMFQNAGEFNGNLSGWDVSSVTDMSDMFRFASSFDQPLAAWNVSSVTDMSDMFRSATIFNQPLAGWDVSSVTYMSNMFRFASSFDQPLADWNVSSVTDMSGMFFFTAFNQTLNTWNVSSVTDMSGMFRFATSFNQTLNTWNVSSATDMSGMFEEATSFNRPLADWNVSSVTDMSGMFRFATSFNQTLNTWNVSSVTDMSSMFRSAAIFNQPLAGWNVSSVTDMSGMFSDADAFEQNLGRWYVVPADAAFDVADASLNVTTISAQNSFLDGHSPAYGIGSGHDSDLFNMTGNTLAFKGAPDPGDYMVSVTASGPDVFESGNNLRVLNVTVTGQDGGTSPDGAFVTTWNPIFPPYTISIPLEVHSGGTLSIDWGDGNTTTVTSNGTQSHAYAAPGGVYQVSMTGDLARINLGAAGSTANTLTSIDSWGDVEWSGMKDAFRGAFRMAYNATDAPDLSGVTDMSGMFRAATKFNGDLSGWNVSSVTDMSYMFREAVSFDRPLAGWDVSSVTDMSYMFREAVSFDRPLAGWDVSSVTDMFGMFQDAISFDRPLAAWNVSSVTDMSDMFQFATSFNQPLAAWNVSSVTDMTNMFERATSFGQNLGNWYVTLNSTSIDSPDTPGVVGSISAQNQPLRDHDPAYGIGDGPDSDSFEIDAGTLRMSLADAAPGTYTANITAAGDAVFESGNNWRVLNVTVTGQDGGTSPDGAFVTTWNPILSPHTISIPLEVHSGGTLSIDWGDGSTDTVTSNGTPSHTYAASGEYRVSMTGDLARINLGAAGSIANRLVSIDSWGDIGWSSMKDAFRRASSMAYNATDAPDLSSVTDMSGMFWSTNAFNGNLSSWNVSSVTDMSNMFRDATSFDQPLAAWNVSSVTDMSGMLQDATSFNQPLSGWDVSSVTDMSDMSRNARAFDQPLADWNVSSVTDMSGMFRNALVFDQPLAAWNVSSVTDMSDMFNAAISFKQPLADWNVSSVTDMSGMFSFTASFNQPLADWDVSSVTDMSGMFSFTASFNQPLADWNVSSVIRMDSTFSGASAFDGDISGWNVSSVKRMNSMFDGASSFDGDISGWDVSGVEAMAGMFSDADAFDQNLGRWYVVPADAAFDAADASLNVTTISAQNSFLDGHTPAYGIGSGHNSDLFSMTGSTLAFKGAPDPGDYVVNVTASGPGVFESGNNWRVLNVTVTGQDGGTSPDGAFVTTWDPTSSPYTISIPLEVHSGGTLSIDWGDGNTTTVTSNGTQSHAYAAPGGVYRVSMTGDLARINLGAAGSTANTLTSIDSWGDVGWSSMKDAFRDASDMVYNATDAPDLSGVADMSGMFQDAGDFDGDLSGWNVSSVTDMSGMFQDAGDFDGDLSGWNVSSVTDMSGMLQNARAFNQPLADWNVSSVTDMSGMLQNARAFNQSLADWNVSSVTDMSDMFRNALVFDQPLAAWNVSSVTDMSDMFNAAISFDQPLAAWNVSSVTDMSDMFNAALSFNQPLADWDVSSVTDMSGMFWNARDFDQTLNGWDISSVIRMDSMFSDASAFDGDISGWNVSSVVHMNSMFDDASSFNGDISGWDVSGVEAMAGMFSDADAFDQNLGRWYVVPADASFDAADTSLNVTTISAQNAFLDGHTLAYGIGLGHNSTLFNMTGSTLAFKGAPDPGDYVVNVTASGPDVFESGNNWRVLNVTVTGQDGGTSPDGAFVTTWDPIFSPHTVSIPLEVHSGGTLSIDWGDGNTTTVTSNGTQSHAYAVPGGVYQVSMTGDLARINLGAAGSTANTLTSIDSWGDVGWSGMKDAFRGAHRMAYNATDAPDLSGVTDMSGMFLDATKFNGDLSGWNVSPVTDMSYMFRSADSFDQPLADWNVSSVTDMSNMFQTAASFNQSLADWNVSSVTDMSGMFQNADEFNGDLSDWNVSSVTDMSNMFQTAASFNQSLADWNVSSVTDMSGMFQIAASFNQPLADWSVSSVTDMSGMFQIAASFNQPLADWSVSSVTDMSGMFFGASSFNRPLSDWNVSSVTGMSRMFQIAASFNQPLADWNVSSVTDMSDMFESATAFDQPLSDWNVSSVTDMSGMFEATTAFDQPLADWNVSSVTDMSGMFLAAASFDQPLADWNVSSVTDMSRMFWNAASFNQPLADWNVSSVTDMSDMFQTAAPFDQNLGNWYVTLSSTSIDSPDTPGVVGSISAQNQPLRDHDPAYGIGDGPDSGSFEIAAGTLRMSLADAAPGTYTANITAAGDAVFVNGSNWRAVQVNVTGAASVPPEVGAGLNLTAAGSITDGGAIELDGASGIAIFESGATTYAAVAAFDGGGVQVLDVTDPSNVAAVGIITDTDALALKGATSIAIFESGGATYAAVTAFGDNGVQVLNVADPSSIAPAGSITDTDALALNGTGGIAIFESGGATYAAVAAMVDNGVQILNVTDPSAVTAAGNITDTDALALDGAWNIAIFESGGATYAAVTAIVDDGVQILNVTDPSSITPAGSITNSSDAPELDGAYGIATFTSGGATYAAVTAYVGDGVQVLDVTDPSSITPAGSIANDDALELFGPRGIATFTSGGATYAAVTAHVDDGVQVLDVTDPSSITPAGSIADDDALALNGADGIAVFVSGGATYAAVAAYEDDGVQVIRLTDDAPQVVPNSPPMADAGPDLTLIENSTFTLAGSATDPDGDALMYAWSQDPPDSGVTFDDDTSPAPTVTLPPVAADTTVTLTLEVRDDSSASADSLALTVAEADGSFITAWEVTGPDRTISIPVGGAAGTYTVVWGDGNASTNVTGNQTHAYATAGAYVVSISGGFERFHLNGDPANAPGLLSIDQWGDAQWTSMEGAFRGAVNMEYNAADAPDLSGVTSMASMFRSASSFNGDLSSWNVSSVEGMAGMFWGASSFNQTLNGWDVSSVEGMTEMFFGASSFDRPLNGWDVSSVNNTDSMFASASSFNQTLNGWNVSSVEGMAGMFAGASSFDGDISGWNVSSVNNMNLMFSGASSFDGDISGWDVSSANNMKAMFTNAASFNRPLNGWNVSSANSMDSMFAGASSFNRPLNGWNVSSVEGMDSMFANAASFNQTLNGWNVSSVERMNSMFNRASSFDGDISGWDVSGVEAMAGMFSDADAFEQNLGRWYVVPADASFDAADASLNVTTISAQNSFLDGHSPAYGAGSGHDFDLFSMTGSTLAFKGVPSSGDYAVNVTASGPAVFESGNNWRVLNVTVTGQDGGTSPDGAFVTTWDPTFSPYTISIPLDVHSGGTLSIDWGDGSTDTVSSSGTQSHTYAAPGEYRVSMAGDLASINLGAAGSTADKLASIDQWGNISWTTMEEAFRRASSMAYNATDAPDLSGVTDMSGMFWSTDAFNGNLSSWNVSSVTDMSYMFRDAASFDRPLAGWDVSSVTDMSYMFSITASFDRPLAGWDVSSVTDMTNMFQDAISFNQTLADWNVSSVTDMSGMFQFAISFDQPLADWNVSSVTDMSSMFWFAASFNQPLADWNVSSVTDMFGMFQDARAFNQPLAAWNVSSVTDMTNMFQRAASFVQNLGNWYVTLNSTSIDSPDTPGVVGSISAQNQPLGNHNPAYGIGDGPDSGSFEIAAGTLRMSLADAAPGTYTANITAAGDAVFESGNNWHALNVTVTGSANSPPVVDAGDNQTVAEGATVSLSGTASDADPGDTLTYEWTHDSALGITFADSAALSTSFTAPDVAADTTITVTLTVNDGTVGVSDTLQVTITDSPNSPPEVTAGADQTVAEGSTVSLSGTATDADPGDTLTYEWTHDSALAITIAGSDSIYASFAAPDVAADTTVTVTLTVSDGTVGVSDTLQVTITDSAAIPPGTNSPPTVNVGQDRTVSEGEPVSLPWSASDDDGDPLTYAWSQSPAVPAIAFASPGSSPTTFTAPRVDSDTLFTLTLTANDGTGDGADSLRLTVRDSGSSSGGSSSGGSSSGGSSSGGSSSGGGGGGAPAAIITDVRIYSVSWDCAAGSVAVTAGPDTDQLSVNIRTSSVGERPVVQAGGELPGTRSFTSAIAGADEFVVVEASLAHEGGHVTTKIVNLRQCVGTVGFDRYEPLQQAVPRPEPEPQELCRDGRAPALRDGNELLCLFPGTFEVLAERGWNLARP